MKVYKILAVLLDYPEQELLDNLPEIEKWIASSSAINARERDILQSHLRHIKNKSLIELQQEYVNTFDMNAEHSLHLTHHLFGDDKNRGPALIDLGELYQDYGMKMDTNELPDYLPLVLEFAAHMGGNEATVFLADAQKVFTVLLGNLKKAASPHADLISIISGRVNLVRIEVA